MDTAKDIDMDRDMDIEVTFILYNNLGKICGILHILSPLLRTHTKSVVLVLKQITNMKYNLNFYIIQHKSMSQTLATKLSRRGRGESEI